ncbi:MAG: hypothetical protein IJ716_12800 [Lachnospiraceae bacterium]|nr:hypothetical protein [Lachnospiraceae bacterium]
MQEKELIKVGKYKSEFNKILGINLENLDIYRSKGLAVHMKKRQHFNCLKYIECIEEIIGEPDYIGINPNEEGTSIELIKRYEDNVLIGIKLDTEQDYFYVSTMHDVQEAKILRRLHSGRLKEFVIDRQEV